MIRFFFLLAPSFSSEALVGLLAELLLLLLALLLLLLLNAILCRVDGETSWTTSSRASVNAVAAG